MNANNPYQPSGSSPAKLIDESEAKTELRSFLDKQFLAFVPTLMVLRIVVSYYDGGWENPALTLGNIPIIFLVLAAFSMVCWLPHYLYAVRSSRVRCGGGSLSGIVGGASFAGSMAIHSMILQIVPDPTYVWLKGVPFYVWLPLYVIVSLLAVTVLGHFRSKYQETRIGIDESSKT